MRSSLPLLCAAAIMACAPAASAAPTPQPYGTNDGGGFRDVLPPGTNGLDNLLQLGAFQAFGTRPAHNDDQRAMYGDLVFAVPGLQAADLSKYYKDSTFGVKPGEAERTYSPRDDVTIVRDSNFGVPHIYGSTRAGAMFGIGYATAEDRLFFIDILRHAGRGQLSSFAGGANIEMDREQWHVAPYTEADLQAQIDQSKKFGAYGDLVLSDAQNYIDGINQYISEARLNPSKMPGEYPLIGQAGGPDDFKMTDLISIASLVGGIFGKGGGGELGSAAVRQAFLDRFGAKRGDRTWSDFRSQEDPEAPTIVFKKKFTYSKVPKKPRGVAIPDKGSFKPYKVVASSSGGGGPHRSGILGSTLQGGPDAAFPRDASNFLVVSAAESQTGHPLAVMGPQVGYFAPQILMEQDVHAPAGPNAPSIDAAGAAFPGVNLYVELGRGRDYAWSATSAGQDIIDTFALPLCDDDHYRFRGTCEPFEKIERSNSWSPTVADSTPAGSETMVALRTKLGLVAGRGTVKGKPVVYVYNRTTYKHEIDNAIAGFMAFNTPEMIRGPEDFQRAAYHIGYTFNWVYADSQHIAYFNSGDNPVRNKHVDPRFPVDAKYEWKGFDPETNLADYTPMSQHPQAIDQKYLASWNGKQAKGYRANDGNYAYGPVDRVQMLTKRIEEGIAGDKRMTLVQLVEAMEDGGTVDLRGQEVLPWVFRVMRKERDPDVVKALDLLKGWVATGAHRRDLNKDGQYDDADAVALMDAWWPKLVTAEFMPALGEDAFKALKGIQGFHDDPHGHLGSSFDDGWYGFTNKDLRMLLKVRVKGKWSRTYCGGTKKKQGSVKACSKALAASLKDAIPLSKDRAKLYGGSDCPAGNQICWDEVRFRALGGVTQPPINWINRPTFQQANEVDHAAPREPGSPFVYPPRR